jgi:hypothetical protein
MSDRGERIVKKPRTVERSPTIAPNGFHYVGEAARFYRGKVTKRLRRTMNILEEPIGRKT